MSETTPPPRRPPLATKQDIESLATWAAATVVAGVAVWLTRGAAHHQLAIGVFLSLLCGGIGLGLVELAARAVAAAQRRG